MDICVLTAQLWADLFSFRAAGLWRVPVAFYSSFFCLCYELFMAHLSTSKHLHWNSCDFTATAHVCDQLHIYVLELFLLHSSSWTPFGCCVLCARCTQPHSRLVQGRWGDVPNKAVYCGKAEVINYEIYAQALACRAKRRICDPSLNILRNQQTGLSPECDGR